MKTTISFNQLLILFALLTASAIFTSYKSSAQTKPNIVFIMGDDMGYNSIGPFGQKLIKTPNLDKLAQNGMKMTNFYANHICSPSRGSFFTGLHTGHALIRGNYELGGYKDDDEYGQMPLAPNMQTLGTELQKAGYTTAVMGKWGMGGPGSIGVPTKQGVDEFFGYLCQKQAQNYYPTHLWKNEDLFPLNNEYFYIHQKMPAGKDINDPASYLPYKGNEYSEETIQKQALDFINNQKPNKPFFLELAYTLPHMALQVPDKYMEQYKGKFDDKPYLGEKAYVPNQYPRATYAAMISMLDDYVGQVMEALKKKGLDKNTLVVFTADNGAATVGGCDPDYFNSSGVLRGRKGSIYEGGIKVPFIAHWPGVIKPGTSSNHLSAIWDLMPTFLDFAGTKEVKGIDGISFLPTLMQQKQTPHKYLYWERHHRKGQQEVVRFGDWKAIKNVSKNTISLYNLATDPSEKKDVAAGNPEQIKTAIEYYKTRRTATLVEWNYGVPAVGR